MINFKLVKLLIAILLIFFINSVKANIEIYNPKNIIVSIDGDINTSCLIYKKKICDEHFTFLRLGIKGKTKIAKKFTVHNRWKHNLKNKDLRKINYIFPKLKDKKNLSYIGFKYGNWGKIEYGNISFIYQTTSLTDMLYRLNSTVVSKEKDFILPYLSNLTKYNNKNFFGLLQGLNFDFQYKSKSKFAYNRKSTLDSSALGYSFLTQYKLKHLTLSTTFSAIGRIDIQNKLRYGGKSKAKIWVTSLRYNAKPIYFGISYSVAQNTTPISPVYDHKTKTVDILIQYRLYDGQIKPTLAYSVTKAKDIDPKIQDEIDIHNYFSLGTSYVFNKNINCYAEYKFNLVKNSPLIEKLQVVEKDIVSLGLNYKF